MKVATYEYATEDYDTIDVTEEQYLWNELYKYFDGNETAVLSVMCNLKAESKLRANNLEDINNEQWNIDDETYTDRINKGLIFRKDFLRSKYKGNTNGYYNDYNEWVNTDGCYIWLKYYEIPYDPYGDDYYTLAFDRAASADEIIALCKGE